MWEVTPVVRKESEVGGGIHTGTLDIKKGVQRTCELYTLAVTRVTA